MSEEEVLDFRIGGMSCAMCVKSIETRVSHIEGVKSVTVNLSTEKARVVFDPRLTSAEDIKSAIEEIGYKVLEVESEKEENESGRLRRLYFAAVAGAFLLIANYGKLPLPDILQMIIASAVMVYSGREMFLSAFRSVRHRTLNMDVMYSMGVGSAFAASILSTVGVLPPEYTFYETSVMLLAFLLLGRTLEARAKARTGEAIRKLAALKAKKAVVLRDGKEVEVEAESVRVGDIVVVKPGDMIPVDGVVVEGESYVDESSITGEPVPKFKSAGDEVIGGTINKNGVLKVRATRVGRDTVIAQIIKVVEEAMSSRPQIQRIADRIVSYFIPTVLSIAIISFVYWYFIAGQTSLFAFTALIAVLVVACPCAFGLATPTALAVGMGKGAELGILIKHGEALEIAGKVSTVVFDKTGTLTRGKPEVTDVVSISMGKDDVLRLAAIAERRSEHPIAEAIVRRAEIEGIEVDEPEKFEVLPGKGVVASINGKRILVGNKKLMIENGVAVNELDGILQDLEKGGKTAVILSLNGSVAGVIGIADTLKDDAAEVVEELHRMGKKVAMITGDNRRTAEAIARQLGIDHVLSEVLPHEKAEEIKRLQQDGEIVAFVGDGINDAPALAQADLGIAIGSGTDVAIESGDIVLIREDLKDVVAAIQLSEKTLGKIKQNIFWALIYNAVLIPMAAGLLYPLYGILFRPEWAGFAMAMSSVSVVTNSLLMKRYVPPVRSGGVK
ncbi:heavy metal translocating P-type ATPase [Archaeoglobus neptunius]|uniref:heavy metal translocating P-type ATPase n=1 Tax=Archaeoglobus neptunius TaxID=2798580 RepID=UPI002EDA298C